MCNYQEDEPPCIHHRSAFDTIPAPPSFEARPRDVATENNLATYGIRCSVPPARYPSEPTMLSFRGGEVELPKPTRADLVLSAQQWATAIRESIRDEFNDDGSTWAKCARIMGNVNRLDAILKELAES